MRTLHKKNLQLFPSRLTTRLTDCLIIICNCLYEIQNFKVCSYRNFIDFVLLSSGSVHDFETVLCSFLFTFATNFNAMF